MVKSLACSLYIRIYRVYLSFHEATILAAILSTLSTPKKSEYKMWFCICTWLCISNDLANLTRLLICHNFLMWMIFSQSVSLQTLWTHVQLFLFLWRRKKFKNFCWNNGETSLLLTSTNVQHLQKKLIHLSTENWNNSSWNNHCHSLLPTTSRKMVVRHTLNCWTDEFAENALHRNFNLSIVQSIGYFSACLHIQEKCCEYNQDLHTVGFDLIKTSVSQNISKVLLPKLGYNHHDNFIASLHTGMKVHVLNHKYVFQELQQIKLKMVCTDPLHFSLSTP